MSHTLTPLAEQILADGLGQALEEIRNNAFDRAVRFLIFATETADLADWLEAP